MMPATDTGLSVTLGDLLGDSVPAALRARPVTDLTLDSRRVTPGALFLALPGRGSHGIRFAAEAFRAGAGAVAWEPVPGEEAPLASPGAVQFAVPGLRARLGPLADRFFGRPSERIAVVGVTGTNGKTTVSHLVAGALERLGRPAGVIGTLGSGRPDALEPAALTTPDVVEVHRSLARLSGRGATAVAMEVSSHALDQGRTDAVRFAVAVFTNLTRDHLDYHGSLAAYGESKARLFLAANPGCAVVNVTDEFGRRLFAGLPAGLRAVAVGQPADVPAEARQVVIESVLAGAGGLEMELSGTLGSALVRSRLVGDFNAWNLALAFATLRELGEDPAAAAAALGALPAPPGRMESFRATRGGPLVVVDYAHTPDALSKALEALRPHCAGRLHCVFGCGGERDPGKRPEMARAAEALADAVVVTDDNPRDEDGDAIVAGILTGFREPSRVTVERDRSRAIRLAVDGASEHDVVLVAGKGHEDYQLVRGERRPYSDRDLVRGLLEERA